MIKYYVTENSEEKKDEKLVNYTFDIIIMIFSASGESVKFIVVKFITLCI